MRKRSMALMALLSPLVLVACSDSGSEPEPSPDPVELMRQATDDYHDVEAALENGFVPLSECVASPAGGMGYHYGNPARIEDTVIDPELPEVLLYAPVGDELRLVGVEFMVHQGAWSAAGNTDTPDLAGQPFDPPDPNHPDVQIREFFTLHAWVWEDNPNGMFTMFNPAVTCD